MKKLKTIDKYRMAIKRLPISKKTYSSNHNRISICRALEEFSEFACVDERFEKEFPEFFMFKPKRELKHGYWLPEDDLQTRQIILDFCIEMTS